MAWRRILVNPWSNLHSKRTHFTGCCHISELWGGTRLRHSFTPESIHHSSPVCLCQSLCLCPCPPLSPDILLYPPHAHSIIRSPHLHVEPSLLHVRLSTRGHGQRHGRHAVVERTDGIILVQCPLLLLFLGVISWRIFLLVSEQYKFVLSARADKTAFRAKKDHKQLGQKKYSACKGGLIKKEVLKRKTTAKRKTAVRAREAQNRPMLVSKKAL